MQLARTRADEAVRPERLFQALGDRMRLRIVSLLRQGDLSGQDLAAALGLMPSALSRHIRVLYQARLVVPRRIETGTYYALATPHDALGIRVWNMLAELAETLPESVPDLARLEEVRADRAISGHGRVKPRP